VVTVGTASGDRGQAYVLEAVISVLVLALALVLGMQAVDIAPWTDGTDRQLDDLRTQADDVLVTAQEEGMLDDIAACVANDESNEPGTVGREGPTLLIPGVAPDTAFEAWLDNTLANATQFAVQLDYPVDDGINSTSLTLQSPLDRPSATASTRVTLSESDEILRGAACSPSGTTLADVGDNATADGGFYFDNQDPDGELYGVVTIRVVVW
jgi:hypothetical protein